MGDAKRLPTHADTIREWLNELLRLRHVLLHATGGPDGENYRLMPSVWVASAVHQINLEATPALRAAGSAGCFDRFEPRIRSALSAFSDFAKLAPNEPIGSPDRVAKLLASEQWRRLRESLDNLAYAIQALPESPAADPPTDEQIQPAALPQAPPGDEYAELRKYAARNLNGGQRRLVECLIEAGGTKPIPDTQAEADIEDIYRTQHHVNKKLRLAKVGWQIKRKSVERKACDRDGGARESVRAFWLERSPRHK